MSAAARKSSGDCNDCPAHDRMEARVDELYERVLPAIGAIKAIMAIVGALVVIAQGVTVWIITTKIGEMRASQPVPPANCQHTASAR